MKTVNRKTRQALVLLTYAQYLHLVEKSGLTKNTIHLVDFTNDFLEVNKILLEKIRKIKYPSNHLISQAFSETIQVIRQYRESFAVSSRFIAQETVVFCLQKFSEFVGMGLIEFSKENLLYVQVEVQKMLATDFTD